jgi:PAS domain S-box-containing protein
MEGDLASEMTKKPKMSETNDKLSLDQMLAGLGLAVFSSIRTPLGIFDRDRRILWINKAMASIHGCDAEEVVGETCSQALHCCDDVCEACFLKEVIAKGRTMVVEKWADFSGGERRWGEVHAYPVRGLDKNVSAVIVIVFETTASKHALQQQKDYTGLLEQRLSEKEGGTKKVNLDGGDIAMSVKLSRRENDVLRLITEGYTNTQISELLDISANTVKSYVNGVFNKLGVNDRTQAAVLATRNRIV